MSEYDNLNNYWLDIIEKITESTELPRRAKQTVNKKLLSFSH